MEAALTAVGPAAPGEDALVLTVQVPAGGPGCSTRPQARVTAFDRETLRMQTVVESNHAPYCTKSVSRTFTAKVALRGRRLVVNGQSWAPGPSAAFVRCNAAVGCAPPSDRCDPIWTSTLTPHFDLPPEKRATVVGCSGRWLVVDIDAVVPACQPVGGAIPSGCTGGDIRRRWFAELDNQRNWRVVASGASAGCADVRRAVPAFPRSLCAGLRAP